MDLCMNTAWLYIWIPLLQGLKCKLRCQIQLLVAFLLHTVWQGSSLSYLTKRKVISHSVFYTFYLLGEIIVLTHIFNNTWWLSEHSGRWAIKSSKQENQWQLQNHKPRRGAFNQCLHSISIQLSKSRAPAGPSTTANTVTASAGHWYTCGAWFRDPQLSMKLLEVYEILHLKDLQGIKQRAKTY